MKKIYTAILSLITVLSYQAQLTQANHAPSNGDTYKTFQCDSSTINPGGAGAGANWNFATIITHSSVVSNYSAMTVSDPSYPNANIAVASSTSNISYISSTSSQLNNYGGNIMIGTVGGALYYTSPAVNAVYPMNLNTTTTSITGGSINALSFPGTFTGLNTILVDGSGTLTLPSGTYTNVLRVVSTQTVNFNLGLATGTLTQKNYDYYSIGTKAPMLTISTSTAVTSLSPLPTSQTVVTRLDPSIANPTVGVQENKMANANVLVFPNPASNSVSFSSNSDESFQVMLFDITGKLIQNYPMTDGKLKVDVSNLNSGLYLYKLVNSQQELVKTGKLTIYH